MPTIPTNCLALTSLCLSITVSALAQQTDTSQSLAAARAAIFYQSYIGADAAIYNGIAYQPNYRGIEGHPYFGTSNLVSGTLIYEDVTYSHIPLLYDLVKDCLVITDLKGQPLIAPSGKVRQFSLGPHTFVNLSVNNIPGYYECLSSGYASLYIRHTKSIEEKLELAQVFRRISSRDEYILYKQDHYYPVTSGKRLLALLSDKTKQLQQFQHARHIRFEKDPAQGMKAVVDDYNQLPH
jgi:hypothetical protein